MCGLSSRTRREHVVRAALEAVCQQTRAVAAAMEASCAPLRRLLADGGMSQNTVLMQMQADLLGIPVVSVTTYLMCAGRPSLVCVLTTTGCTHVSNSCVGRICFVDTIAGITVQNAKPQNKQWYSYIMVRFEKVQLSY